MHDANRIDQMLQALTDRAVDDSRVNAQDFQHFMALRDGIRDLLHVDRDLEDQADRAAEREEETTVTTEVLIESEGATPLAVHALTAAVKARTRVGEMETTVLGRADRYLEWLREQAQPDGSDQSCPRCWSALIVTPHHTRCDTCGWRPPEPPEQGAGK